MTSQVDGDLPRPRFLLRIPDFTIVEYSRQETKEDVERHGYGIISYTWGRFQDRRKREMSPQSPRFHPSIPMDMRWHFPKLIAESFTMEMVRGVLEHLGTKYAWWDWACIPQFWNSGNTPDPSDPAGPAIGFLKDEYKWIKDEEISKQLFIYTMASKGFIWLHDTVWASGHKRRTKSYLEQLLLRNKEMHTDEYLALLEKVKETENWFSSMWTFQEGILLNTEEVIDPRTNKVVIRRTYRNCGILVDKNSEPLRSDIFFRDDSASLIDITGRVTMHACDIAAKLVDIPVRTEQLPDTVSLQHRLVKLNGMSFSARGIIIYLYTISLSSVNTYEYSRR